MRRVNGRQPKGHRPIPSPLRGLRVLVVEDEGLLGVLVEHFGKFGCEVAGVAGNAIDACQMIRTVAIDVAIVDFKLQDGMAYSLADALIAAGVPFVFATSIGNNEIDGRFSHVPVIKKPFDEGELRGALLEAISIQRGLWAAFVSRYSKTL